jgi:hypothetical protein
MDLVKRSELARPLTNSEMDDNFTAIEDFVTPREISATYVSSEAELLAANVLSTTRQIVLMASFAMSQNITLTKPFRAIPGSLITTTGYTLTINGPFEAGCYQVFAGTGPIVFNSDVVNPNGWFAAGQNVTFNAGLAASHNLISTNMSLGANSPVREIKPEWWGAVGNDSTDSTTALQSAATSAGSIKTLLLTGTYSVTATSGNFAVTAFCPIKGVNPIVSGIHNVGAGSALLLGNGAAGTIYYNRWENFSVTGNNSSQDGIVTMTTVGATSTAVAYSSFSNVYSTGHGRYGLRHRNAYGTKYLDCKFQNNLGAGIILETPGTPPSVYEGLANGVTFINCDSRHNGGTKAQEPSTGSASTDTFAADGNGVYHAGVIINSAAGVQWIGGIVEHNDAWGFIISPAVSGASVGSLHLSPAYMEVNPASAPVGGNVYTSGPWNNITVSKSVMYYGGAAVGQTGYNFYVTGGATEGGGNNFKAYDNSYSTASYAGTKIFSFGASQTPPVRMISARFGDKVAANVASDTTIVSLSSVTSGVKLSGFITSQRTSDSVGAIYPFLAVVNGATRTSSIGAAIAGASTAAPTMAWSGNDLKVALGGLVEATIDIIDASGGRTADYDLTYSPTLFGSTIMRRE